MKKTQLALAAVALVASTAAMADGVTVYGRLDTSIASQSGQATQLNHSNWDTSLIGFKGSEDLGGGLKASFQLEGGLNSTSGESANNGTAATMFNRLANISVGGEFGSVGLGLQFSPFVGAALTGVATNNESFYVPMLVLAGAAGATTYGTQATGGFFIPNAVSYSTPNIAGFSASVLSQLANSGAATKPANNKYDALAINYGAGDLTAAFGYQDSGTADSKAWTLSGAYNMGPARVAAGYISNDPKGAGSTINTWHVGASYAVLENLSASLNYARNNRDNVGAVTGRNTLTTLGLNYSLSKRTYLYAIAARGTNGTSPLYGSASTQTDSTGYAIGAGHNF